MSENWRTEIDAQDFFGNQKKRSAIEQRRPLLRQASDFVGPGIGVSSTRITNFNDILALCNGYFSCVAGTTNAPTSTQAFTGYVIMDAEFGGQQVFRGMTTGTQYVRIARRNPSDPDSITWGAWVAGA